MYEDTPCMVMDIGSAQCKIGLAGDDAPLECFPTLIGIPKQDNFRAELGDKDYVIGRQTKLRKEALHVQALRQHGRIKNWENFARIQQYSFSKIKLNPRETTCLLTEYPGAHQNDRQKTVEIMFEQLDVPAFCLAPPTYLPILSTGRCSGIVLNIGETLTLSSPFYEGFQPPYCNEKIGFGGRDLDKHMKKLLNEIGINYGHDSHDTAENIKQKHGYIALDYEAELKSSKDSSKNIDYKLPDGKIIKINSQRYRCPQILFNPEMIHRESPGIHQVVVDSINKFEDFDIRKQLYCNIIVSGGSTLFPGISERLTKQINQIAPKNAKAKVIAPKERNLLVWIGGSIYASMKCSQQRFIKKQEYMEMGPSIVHRKCF